MNDKITPPVVYADRYGDLYLQRDGGFIELAENGPMIPCQPVRALAPAMIQGETVEIRETDLRFLLALAADHVAADPEFRARMLALLTGRRAAGLSPQDKRWVDHIDGDPRNNDPANLRIVDPKENER